MSLVVASALVGGCGQGPASPGHRRAAVISTLFVVACTGISVPAIGVGLLTEPIGLEGAGQVFIAYMAALVTTAFVCLVRRPAPARAERVRSYARGIVTVMGEPVERVDEQDRVIGVVDRDEAIRNGWLHRVATTVCRDARGRVLVYRRPDHVSRFPGRYDWLFGGGVGVGESYEEAAARELAEELGVRVPVRRVLTFLCRGAISPYWLGVHEAVVTGPLTPDPSEIAWHGWLDEREFREAVHTWEFVPDGLDALRRHPALSAPGTAAPPPPHPPV